MKRCFLPIVVVVLACALCSFAQLVWVATWKPMPNQIHAAWSQDKGPRDHPLLVWILFDELSYDQVFEHRAHDLSLPNFDALRTQSTLFTHTRARYLLFEDSRKCRGVRAARAGETVTFRAERGVILAAGAIGTPTLLLRSGIGAAADLEALGIGVRHDLPGVAFRRVEHRIDRERIFRGNAMKLLHL